MNILFQFEGKPLLFDNPRAVIACNSPSGIKGCFRAIEDALARGRYAAGFLSYEAGACFEKKLLEERAYDFPLVHFGVFDPPKRSFMPPERIRAREGLRGLRLNITREKYFGHINAIRDLIAAGEVYQITYCLKMLFSFDGDPGGLYHRLLREQPVPYPAFLQTDDITIASLSPELFLRKQGGRILSKPMKGTWPRGGNAFSDLIARARFQYDKKNRAENVMIADLLRNDLGRVAINIRAPRLFEVAGYTTLFQMTSTVTGDIDPDVPLYDLFAAVFPSGSVTGAPRMRAMEAIRDLEGGDRRIYTGAIGWIAPNRDLFFNIPIRTLLLRNGQGEMGIGGGIVWDSTPQGEWDEGLLKAQFLTGGQRLES